MIRLAAYMAGDPSALAEDCDTSMGTWCPGSGNEEDAGDAQAGDDSDDASDDAGDATVAEGPPDPPGTVGTATGDPHLRTFDGLRYDCQPWGEETLCRSLDGTFEVQVRTHQLNAENVATITAVAARVGSDEVAFYLDTSATTVNGAPQSFAALKTVLPGGGTVWNRGGVYTVVWPAPDSSQLKVGLHGFYMSAQVNIDNSHLQEVEGLLGNANGSTVDDIMPKGSDAGLASPASFVSFYGDGGYSSGYVGSWRLAPDASMFQEYPDGGNVFSPTITNLKFPARVESVDDLDGGVAETSTLVCQAAGVSQDWLPACVLDVSLTDAAAAQAFNDAPPAPTAFEVLSPPVATGCSAGCGLSAPCSYELAAVSQEGQHCPVSCTSGVIMAITVTYADNCAPKPCPAAAAGCLGSTSCSIVVDNAICPPDPCVGTPKSSNIQVTCGQGVAVDASVDATVAVDASMGSGSDAGLGGTTL